MAGLVAGKFRLCSRVNSGSFGEVFEGLNEQTGTAVAIKIEAQNVSPQIIHEAKVLRLLEGQTGLPTVLWYGKDEGRSVMVMTLLGKSLEMSLKDTTEKRLPLKLVLRLSLQMLARIEATHSQSFIHRDIKPDNFVIGRSPAHNRVYLIDFGLAKRYRDEKTRMHEAYAEGKMMAGTARYASLNCLLGVEQSRRDDLESLVYSLVYLLNGSLPWQGLFCRNQDEKREKVSRMKRELPLQTICKGCPPQFVQLLTYCRRLPFDATPDYDFMRFLLKEAASNAEIDIEGSLIFPAPIQRSSSQRRLLKKKLNKQIRTKSVARLSIAEVACTSVNEATEEVECSRLPAIHPILRLRLRAYSNRSSTVNS